MSMAKVLCRCRAHQEARANYEEALQLGRWDEAIILSRVPILNTMIPVVDADDPIEAAVAQGCSCLAIHAIALSGDAKPWDFFGTPWTLEKDTPEQIDGDGGEA